MSSRRVLGTIRSSYAIEARALALLARYLPLYLDEVARQEAGGGSFQRPPRPELATRLAAADVPDEYLPALIVTLEGTTGAPVTRAAEGTWAASWTLRLTALALGDEEGSRALAAVTVAAASAVVAHTLPNAGLGVTAVRWSGERHEQIAVENGPRQVSSRTLELDVRDALSLFGTPPVPPDPANPPDPGEFQTVETTHLAVTPVEEVGR